jgi:hypothetical protein
MFHKSMIYVSRLNLKINAKQTNLIRDSSVNKIIRCISWKEACSMAAIGVVGRTTM